MTDREFLHWVADRLVYVLGEHEQADFIQRIRRIANSLPPELPRETKLPPAVKRY